MAADEFGRLFERFKTMLAPYAARLHVGSDGPVMYGVDMAPEGEATRRPGSRGLASASAMSATT